MIREQRYNLFGYRFSFRTNYPRAAELLADLYTGKADDSGLEPHNIYELLHLADPPRGEPEWRIHVPGPPPHGKPNFGEAISGVEAAITADMARHPLGLHVVHGGVLYSDYGDLLLSGDSEAGKTTLTLGLASRGLRVGADDMALLDPDTGELLPHPRCFHIDDKSAALLTDVGLVLPQDLLWDQFVTPRSLGMGTPSAARLGFVFLLEPERLKEPRIVPETQAEAVSRLLMQTGRGGFSSLEGVQAIAGMVGSARCFRLWSGTLADTTELVLNLVKSGG